MTVETIIEKQITERNRCFSRIMESKSPKKVIVSGPGTGKTFTFKKLIELAQDRNNLAFTFTKLLVADMESSFGTNCEVKTFHGFCKKFLHQQKGNIRLSSHISDVINDDARFLGQPEINYIKKIQTLDESGFGIDFYLQRGDYYAVVGFDDSVYRLYKQILKHPEIIPNYDQIVVDEYQDFNPLEVAFIEEISKHGNILIVGDDDQAIYDNRSASPRHLRKMQNDNDYEKFELPFCSRCTKVIVDVTNEFIKKARSLGHLKNRVPKRFECFLYEKLKDSEKYPKVIFANVTLGTNYAKFIEAEIKNLSPSEISKSRDNKYSTVLVVGAKQYLREIENNLRHKYPDLMYPSNEGRDDSLVEGYKLISEDEKSNYGWRLVMNLLPSSSQIRDIIRKTIDSTPIYKFLPKEFLEKQISIAKGIRAFNDKAITLEQLKEQLFSEIGDGADYLLKFIKEDTDEKAVVDPSKPSILLSSFKGCKGLSAGHVFLVGVHTKTLPRKSESIDDVEISQFIVAMTRTRKQCYILTNDWLNTPKNKKGFLPKFERSPFIDWIPKAFIEDRGILKASDIK